MKKISTTTNSLQSNQLSIKVRSNDNPYHSPEIQKKLSQPRKLSLYFIVLIESGSISYNIDGQEYKLSDGQLLFAMPNQFFIPPAKDNNLKYVKLLFDDNTLALLPQPFPFLINPLSTQT